MLPAGRRAAQEDPLHIVAAAVRENGHACEEPKSVAPDSQDTSPDERAWIIDCGNKTYRVKFVGDAAVEVSAVAANLGTSTQACIAHPRIRAPSGSNSGSAWMRRRAPLAENLDLEAAAPFAASSFGT